MRANPQKKLRARNAHGPGKAGPNPPKRATLQLENCRCRVPQLLGALVCRLTRSASPALLTWSETTHPMHGGSTSANGNMPNNEISELLTLKKALRPMGNSEELCRLCEVQLISTRKFRKQW